MDELLQKLGALRAIRLTDGEFDAIHNAIMAASPRTAPEPTHLFEHEKAMIYDALAIFVQRHKRTPDEIDTLHVPALGLWRGINPFRHLQPVLVQPA
jgi:hypothetical protein